MKKLIAALMLCLVTLSAIAPAHAHSGRTDKNGCHNDNKNGGKALSLRKKPQGAALVE